MQLDFQPDPERPASLMAALCDDLTALPTVRQIRVFGSLARGDADRWSDIDLIVVTPSRRDFSAVLAQLQSVWPMVHHAPFTPRLPEPWLGSNMLGCVFEGESLWHCLDLNLFSLAEAATPGAFDRFGPSRVLLARPETPGETIRVDAEDLPAAVDETGATIARLNDVMHFTRKAVKSCLRHGVNNPQCDRHTVRQRAVTLRQTLATLPVDFRDPNGDSFTLARRILALAESVLR